MAAHAGHDVARLDGASVGHVLAGGDDPHYIESRLQLGQRPKSSEYAGGAAHVELHLVHLGGGLDGDAAGVKSNSFADKNKRGFRAKRTRIAKHDQPQWLCRALRHRHESAHFQLFDFLWAHHFNFDVGQFPKLFGRIGQLGRRRVIGGSIGPFFRKIDALHDSNCTGKSRFLMAGVIDPDDDTL